MRFNAKCLLLLLFEVLFETRLLRRAHTFQAFVGHGGAMSSLASLGWRDASVHGYLSAYKGCAVACERTFEGPRRPPAFSAPRRESPAGSEGTSDLRLSPSAPPETTKRTLLANFTSILKEKKRNQMKSVPTEVAPPL